MDYISLHVCTPTIIMPCMFLIAVDSRRFQLRALHYVVRWPYTAKHRSELTVRKGDEVSILKRGSKDDMYKVFMFDYSYC